jgi:serine/threonine protein kinase
LLGRVHGGELFELVLDERQAQRIFHGLSERIALELALEVDAAHLLDGRVVVADLAQDFRGEIGVEARQRLAPLEITLTAGGVARTRDFPAPDVLTAGGKSKRLGRGGVESIDPRAQPFGVDQLARARLSPVVEQPRIGRILGVERGHGGIEPSTHASGDSARRGALQAVRRRPTAPPPRLTRMSASAVCALVSPDEKQPTREAAPPSSTVHHARGDRIAGKYRLVAQLGEGGMGEVWVALNEQLDVQVAIKLVAAAGQPDELAARFSREARSAARLNHPAIVRVFDFGKTDGGELFMVMELLHGKSLGHLLHEQARLPMLEVVRTLLPIADALATAHASGVVHRDVKPDNILLAEAAGRIEPKLLDFGISIVTADADAKRITQRGMIVGTPDYLSPEQAIARDEMTPATDIWSFCVVLYEAIAGVRPFVGGGQVQVLSAILHDAPKALPEHGVGDAELWAILERGLKKDPGERFAKMRELGGELARWLLAHDVSSDVTGASLSERWPAANAKSEPEASEAPLPPSPPAEPEPEPDDFDLAIPKRRAPLFVFRALMLLLLAVLGFVTVRWLR